MGPSRQEVSSGSSYRPSEGTLAATSIIPSSRHTNLRQHLNSQRSRQDEWASREVTPQRARRSLNFSSSVESRADDSKRIIAELRLEISDLRKEARGRSPAKVRPRRRLTQYDQEDPGPSSSAHINAWAETPLPSEETPRSSHRSGSVRANREKSKHSYKSISGHHDRGVLPPTIPRKTAWRGKQGAVWKVLDLVSSSPFSKKIERAKLLEKFMAPRFKVYDG